MQDSPIRWHQHSGWESLFSFSARGQHLLVSSDNLYDKIEANDEEFKKEPFVRLRSYLDYV